MKKYTVIIPVYNSVDEVEDLLDSLRVKTASKCEVIIV